MKDFFNYQYNSNLSIIENLQVEHQQYENFQKECQNGVIKATLKLAEIYIKTKIELNSTNQAVAEIYGKTEATIRNYIKIYTNKKLFETPVSNGDLSIRNMLAIVNGKKYIDKSGNLQRIESNTSKTSSKTQCIEELKAENIFLKETIEGLNNEIIYLKKTNNINKVMVIE